MSCTLEAHYVSAHALLQRYAACSALDRARLVMSLRPRGEDYRRLFGPEPIANDAEARYLKLWTALPAWPLPPSPTFAIACATTEQLKAGAGEARQFPTGYRHVACWLQPGTTWATCTIARAGRYEAVLVDGLVELEPGRWLWCPQPWRVLPPEPPPTLWWD